MYENMSDNVLTKINVLSEIKRIDKVLLGKEKWIRIEYNSNSSE